VNGVDVTVPALWRSLVYAVNDGRVNHLGHIPDGEPGIRDVCAPCEDFTPAGQPYELAQGTGSCETDGHYLCSECVHIDERTLRRRRDLCEDCGAKMVRGLYGLTCSAGCDAEHNPLLGPAPASLATEG
jgi:hypothetical protein